MICALCGRPMLNPAVMIGQMGIGPKCAKKAGLVDPARRGAGYLRLYTPKRARRPADGQMALELEAVEGASQ